MKMQYKLLLLSLFILGSVLLGFSQNLDKLPQTKRDSLIMEIAKATVLKYGKGYYREVTPSIERNIMPKEDGFYGEKHHGRALYIVKYPYDKEKELLNLEYTARVFIWANTGKAFDVLFGNGIGKMYLDDEKKLKSGEPIREIPYEQWHKVKVEPANTYPKVDLNPQFITD